MAEARRLLISGRVQGVGFRAATRAEALALDLAGHARNLRDGRVEVLAEGELPALDTLTRWLRQGPPLSSVEQLEMESVAVVGYRGFLIG